MPKPPSRIARAARFADAELAALDDTVAVWPGREVTVRGRLTLNVRSTPSSTSISTSPSGISEPAVLVHGLGGSAQNWTDFAGALRNRFAVHALDLPGHGFSGPAPGGRYTPDTHADAVIDYIDEHVGEPVHLAGNSMGGAICILLAAKRPDLVRTLTLISPAIPDNRIRAFALKNDPRLALLMLPVLGEALTKRFNRRYAVEVRVGGTIALCFADAARFPEARRREAEDEARARLDMPWAEKAVLRSMRSLAVSQFVRNRAGWATMRAITAPTLVIWGDVDKLVAPDLAPYVAAAIPDATLLVMPGVGHTAMMEDPVGTARLMVGLVDDAAGTPAGRSA